jgi:SAM-dependent methyltransferase
MKLPVIHADAAYERLQELYGIPAELSAQLFDNEAVAKLNLNWGSYANITEAKAPIYEALLAKQEGDLIIEGFSMSYPEDRIAVEAAIGPHRAVILVIDLPFAVWAKRYADKMGRDGGHLESAYRRIANFFEARPQDVVYRFADSSDIDAHYAPYQLQEFIKGKIEALKIPINRGDRVNDIGCNEGLIGRWCLEQGAALVRGYDMNWRFLDIAAQNGLEVSLGNVETMNIDPADVNICSSVFHYFKNPQDFLKKIRASTVRTFALELPILNSGGYMSQFVPQNRCTWYSRSLIELWLNENFADVRCVGPSVSPDGSTRLVYHCSVQPELRD